MSADLVSETRISLNQLAHEQGVALSTCWRWCLRGIKGHLLESVSVGGRKFTTREAFARFIARTNGERVVSGQTPRQRERAIQRAEKRAQELGI